MVRVEKSPKATLGSFLSSCFRQQNELAFKPKINLKLGTFNL